MTRVFIGKYTPESQACETFLVRQTSSKRSPQHICSRNRELGRPLGDARFTTAAKEPYVQVVDHNGETPVLVDIESWKLTLKNGVTPQKQQGRLGTASVVIGKCEVTLDLKGYLTQDDGYKACVDNRPLRFGAGLRNADGGVFFDVPSLTFNDGPLDFPANGPVMIGPKAGGFRDHVFNYTLGMSLFPHLPAT